MLKAPNVTQTLFNSTSPGLKWSGEGHISGVLLWCVLGRSGTGWAKFKGINLVVGRKDGSM
jgi:hypothetical protein